MEKRQWKRTFYTIWGGQAVSLLTSAIVQYVLLWKLTADTQSAAMLSLATLIGFLPMALFSPFIGSFVDKHNRKTIMLAADGAIALTTAGLVFLAAVGRLTVPVILAAMFVRAIGSAFHEPCLQAVTPLIVPAEELARCNGYTFSFQALSLIASPAIAAAGFAVLPLSALLSLDLLGAAAGMSTLAVSTVPRLQEAEAQPLHVLADTMEGLRLLRRERGIYWMVWICVLFTAAYIPSSSLYPLMCMSWFGGTTTHAGIAESAFAVGALAGGLVLGRWGGGRKKAYTMAGAVLIFGLAVWAMGMLPSTGFAAFAVLTLISGLTVPFFNSIFMTIIQQRIAPEFLGRVFSVSSSMMALASPVGLTLSGAFAEQIGLSRWFQASGLICVACGVLCIAVKPIRSLNNQPERTESS